MKRIVWIAATILIMLGIIGYGIYSMKHIDEINKRRREKEEGEKMASQIAIVPATTSIWDVLNATEAPTDETSPQEGDPGYVPEAVPDGSSPEDAWLSTEPAPEEGGEGLPEVVTDAPVQTSTVATGFVVHMD